MPKQKQPLVSQSVYLFTTVVAFFAGLLSAPVFMYMGSNYYSYMASMGNTRVTISILLFWLILTFVLTLILGQLFFNPTVVPQTNSVRKQKPSRKKK